MYVYIYLYTYMPGPSILGAHFAALQEVNSTSVVGFHWHPGWKVLVYSKVSLNILRVKQFVNIEL